MKRIRNKKGRSLLMTIVVLSVILIIMPVIAVGDITATRDISKQTVALGKTFTVTVTITASQTIYAPILDEDLPTNWTVTPLQNDGAIFKESEIKWLWMESLSEGDSRTVVYNVTVPSDAESGVYYITGRISAYQIPYIDVGGESEINVEVVYFDTGPGTYPCIFGTHNGTIKPNQTITVQKLYTYPCPGTGGHTEIAMIWNKTIGECVVAEWNGYIGDYHNITFNKTLTLEEGVIYNYTIRTGSYPQIIHESPFNATGGTITCDKFIDANGKEYTDWIPAIRLFL